MNKINPHIVAELEDVAKIVYGGDPKSPRRFRENIDARVAIFTKLVERHKYKPVGAIYGITPSSVWHLLNSHEGHLKTNSDYRMKFETFSLTINCEEFKKKLARIEVRSEVNRLTLELYAAGYSSEEIEAFWHKCINEVKTKSK